MNRRFDPVNPDSLWHVQFLYDLLAQRPAGVSISHKRMPSWEEHRSFVQSRPYQYWYMIVQESNDGSYPIGTVYLTKQDEIGVHLMDGQTGRGIGREAVEELMKRHPRKRYLANIAPTNERSIEFFTKLGFRCCQHTFEKVME